jgi:hypothetical protein
MHKRKPRLIPQHDPTSIFDDLEALRKATAKSTVRRPTKTQTPSHRARSKDPFAQIPLWQARKIYGLIGSTSALLIEITYLVFKHGNPVKLTTEALQSSGLTRYQVRRALNQLERADIVTVERKRGRCPLVLHLWYTRTIG